MRIVIFLAVVVGLVVCGRGDPECPAKDNTKEGWARELPDPCQDLSSDCNACEDKCNDADFSHWMEKNCPLTCGICVQTQIVVRDTDIDTICWSYSQGYADEDILESFDYTTFKDCTDRCLDNDECGGATVTEYFTSPKYCVLAKSGASLTSKSYYFGATRACLEDNPGDGCEDYWSACATYEGTCASDCPYWSSLLTSVCIETCKICPVKWTIIEGQKSKGNSLADDTELEEAKAYCIEQKDACAGLSCKGTSKCSAVDAVDDTKSKNKYDIYQKDDPNKYDD